MLPPGISVGHAVDAQLRSGVTVLLPDEAAPAAVHVMGGSPGTRETDLLRPAQAVERIDALVFSGGSAYGLDAAAGVQAWLREQDRGFPADPFRIPIVPAAILFDLRNGGDKGWLRYPPYRELGYEAVAAATTTPVLGAVGAGVGARTANTPGGVGLATERVGACTVTSLAITNAVGLAACG